MPDELNPGGLGVSQRDVAEPEYVRITRDYTLAGAAAMLGVNPSLAFRFLITSADLARAMIYAVTHGADRHVLDNLALRRLAHLAAKQ